MSGSEMRFSDKMDIVMETIWYLRSSTQKKKLRHTEVQSSSALFAAERAKEKGVTRQSWLKPDANDEWRAIRRAIDGELSPSHPVERRIAEFSGKDKAGRFAAKIAELDAKCDSLRQKLKEAGDRYADFEQLVLEEQYLNNHGQIHLKKLRHDLENKTQEVNAKDKILNAAQAEADTLRSENKKFRKHAGATEVIENAKYRLIEPQVSALVDVPDHKLLTAYKMLVKESSYTLLSLFDKSPQPKDVVLVFHAFNTDVPTFVRVSVPFRHSDGNVVFACCLQNPESRRLLFEDIAAYMAPLKPRVVIIASGMFPQTDVDRATKIINIGQKSGDIAINQRLRQALGNRYRPEYDVVAEGYDFVKIVREASD
ncbi:hypothetical protein [Oryzomonas rubra]|uniref:Uncharacterized protein n=1 Tax=Oryzomonas rubra TaxID=2509454 RepID=A0A5A9X4R8_9BACT|nr:hypothetical protein [Oryzomonas rubra]KAA0888142.1 hypothetical protein ET418_17250 [Oryzomonas rubra]